MENPKDCYCCHNQPSTSYSLGYDVPMCTSCHMGISLMSWEKPSKESVDKYREKMFSNVDRIKKANEKLGHEWNDPRGDIPTPSPLLKDIKKAELRNQEANNGKIDPDFKKKCDLLAEADVKLEEKWKREHHGES